MKETASGGNEREREVVEQVSRSRLVTGSLCVCVVDLDESRQQLQHLISLTVSRAPVFASCRRSLIACTQSLIFPRIECRL